MTLKEYAPRIVSKLTASGLEPFKQILLLNKVEQKIGKEATLPELEELVEEELKQIDFISYESYKKLNKDVKSVTQLEDVLDKYLPRGFTTPEVQGLKEVFESLVKEFEDAGI